MGWGNETPIADMKRAHAASVRLQAQVADLEVKLADAQAELADVVAERDLLASRLAEIRSGRGCDVCRPCAGTAPAVATG